MKLVTFLHQSSEKIGAIIGNEIIDFSFINWLVFI